MPNSVVLPQIRTQRNDSAFPIVCSSEQKELKWPENVLFSIIYKTHNKTGCYLKPLRDAKHFHTCYFVLSLMLLPLPPLPWILIAHLCTSQDFRFSSNFSNLLCRQVLGDKAWISAAWRESLDYLSLTQTELYLRPQQQWRNYRSIPMWKIPQKDHQRSINFA